MIASTQTRIALAPCAGGFAGRVNHPIPAFARPAHVATRPKHVPQALPDPQLFADLAAAGDVDAPLPVVAGLAIVISAAALLFFSFGLKPGADAAADIQKRDAKSGRYRK